MTVEVEVANEGDVAGEETLFLFLRDPVASVARPVLELKGFAKAVLKAGRAQDRAVHARSAEDLAVPRPRSEAARRAGRVRDFGRRKRRPQQAALDEDPLQVG